MSAVSQVNTLKLLCELMQLVEDFDLSFDGVDTWSGGEVGDQVAVQLVDRELRLVGEDDTEILGTFGEPVTGGLLNDCLPMVQHDAYTVVQVVTSLEQYQHNDVSRYDERLI